MTKEEAIKLAREKLASKIKWRKARGLPYAKLVKEEVKNILRHETMLADGKKTGMQLLDKSVRNKLEKQSERVKQYERRF